MQAIGLFEAKTHLSEYVARAEAGEEVVIMRHQKPVARIVPFAPRPETDRTPVPKFVQRTFNMGKPLTDMTQLNKLAGELENLEYINLTARLANQANIESPGKPVNDEAS